MFCPGCGSSQSDELKFCKICGVNLSAVRQVIDGRDSDQKFDWSKTWVAEMFMSGEEAERRKIDMEHRRGITPATRRYQEIKAGVITSSAGLGVSAVLFVLMQGIIRGGNVSTAAAEILSGIWIVGIIPVLIGMALIINGYFVSRKLVELVEQNQRPAEFPEKDAPQLLQPADTSEFVPPRVSVTEGTTKHLSIPSRE